MTISNQSINQRSVGTLRFWSVLVFSAKECGPTAGLLNENDERKEKCDYVRLDGTLDEELPNAEPQLPISSYMLGVLNIMQHMLISPRSDRADICQFFRYIARHPETKRVSGNLRPHNTKKTP